MIYETPNNHIVTITHWWSISNTTRRDSKPNCCILWRSHQPKSRNPKDQHRSQQIDGKYEGHTNTTQSNHCNSTGNICQMYHMLKESSHLNQACRLRLLKTLILPTVLYGQELWSRAAHTTIRGAQQSYHTLSRRTLGIPWFIRNQDVHTDFNLPSLSERI